MTLSRARRTVPLLVAVGLLAFGCASPPEAEKKAADAAVAAAKSAGAEQYAKADFTAASDALKAAEAEMGGKKYAEAKASYEKVTQLADKAAKAAQAGRAQVKAEADQLAADLEKRWQDTQARAKAAQKKLEAEARQAWEAAAKAVPEGLAAARSGEPAAAREKLTALAATLDKWDADLAALVASAKPAKPAPAAKKKK